MSDSARRTFLSDFKQFFLRGLVVLLPSVLTLWIVVKAYQFVDNTIAQPINRGVRITMAQATPFWRVLRDEFEPTDEAVAAEADLRRVDGREPRPEVVRVELRRRYINQWWDEHWWLDLIGILVAIVSVYIAGRLLGGFLGRRSYRMLERLITSLPVFKQVYPYVKQIVDFLFSDEQPLKFNRVVVVEYPRKGIWSVGFLTGPTLKSIAGRAGDAVTVFVPSSPTPFTGYTFTVPRDEVMELPISVEEAIRFAVSGGVLIPDHQSMPATAEPQHPDLIDLPLTQPPPPDGASVPPADDAGPSRPGPT